MIKLKTDVLRDMLNRAIKVCSFKKMLPLTSLVEIETNEKGLSVKTTDNVTTMIITEAVEGLTPARVVVDASIITALVNKITTDEIELNITDSALTIVGNGVYNLEIRVDESGEIIKLPAINQDLINSANKEFDFKGIVEKLKICKSAIPENTDQKELNNYYLKDIVVATNVQKLSAVANSEIMKNEELFIPDDFGNILMQLDFVKANYAKKDEVLVIVGENFVISTTMYGEFNKYPLEGILGILKQDYLYSAVIKKASLSSLLDRLTLFISEYDANSINFTFTADNLRITNQKKTCNEAIEYVNKNVDGITEFSCPINIEYFKNQIDVLPGDEILFKFGGNDVSIAMFVNDITQVAAIMQED
jgi:DNA polymerase III sliding clamp (beta) subunit (PCNA family)